ncbi:MAG: maltotransferase domain-containing protein, partial [Spirochaetaceae bacterium]
MVPQHGRQRVVIRRLRPEVAAGEFTLARTLGEEVRVQADAFADGHDVVAMRLRYRRQDAKRWNEVVMTALGNDTFEGHFTPEELGFYEFSAV